MCKREFLLAGLISDVGLIAEYALGIDHLSASVEFYNDCLRKRVVHLLDKPDQVNDFIKNHHCPSEDREEQMLAQAQVMAMGTQMEAPESPEWKQSPVPHLVAVASLVYEGTDKVWYQAQRPLSLSRDVIFPVEESTHFRPLKEQTECEYQTIWDGLCSECDNLPTEDFDAFFTSLYYLLMKWAWAVPATRRASLGCEDISLFERLRLTVAIAVCLSDFNDLQWEQIKANPKVGFISGDLSGIQSFLYTLSSEGVARGLRGRSAYLQLISDAVAQYILREWNLPITNLLYSSGGNFYLLVPKPKLASLAEVRQAINRKMLKHFKGDVYCALAGITLSREDLLNGEKLSQRWGEMAASVTANKRQKFVHSLTDYNEKLFKLGGGGSAEDICKICNDEPVEPHEDEDEDDQRKGALCKSFEELGRLIKDADYIVQAAVSPGKPLGLDTGKRIERNENNYLKPLAAFGTVTRFIPEKEVVDTLTWARDIEAQEIRLLRLNDTRPALAVKEYGDVARGFKFMATLTPHIEKPSKENPKKTEEQVADFSDLAESVIEGAVTRWGCLRMDVDNLGNIFKEGFQQTRNRTNLARTSTLSFQLSLFFEGYLNVLLEQYNHLGKTPNDERCIDGKDHVYIIYSGGDDLFIVGSWDTLMVAAKTIRDDFRDFVCHNKHITLSGGISLHPIKYPLYKSAETAHSALELAKEHQNPKTKAAKDAFGCFGRAFSWDDEFENVLSMKELLLELVKPKEQTGSLSSGFLQRLTKISSLYQQYQRQLQKDLRRMEEIEEMLMYHKWCWRLVYALTREDKRFEAKLSQLYEKLTSEKQIEYLDIPIRWVHLLTREE